jgi:hypothetical protein
MYSNIHFEDKYSKLYSCVDRIACRFARFAAFAAEEEQSKLAKGIRDSSESSQGLHKDVLGLVRIEINIYQNDP